MNQATRVNEQQTGNDAAFVEGQRTQQPNLRIFHDNVQINISEDTFAEGFYQTFANGFQTMTTTPRAFPRMKLTDVRGQDIDVTRLASDYHLILITLKRISCPVCPQLLRILNLYGLDPNTNQYVDPFTQKVWEINPHRKRFFRLLLKRDAYFIVLCPGDPERVAEMQRQIPFMDYPFIAGDQAMTLGRALKLTMSDTELWPATLEVAPSSLATQPIYIGRAPGHYNHQHLLKRLIMERCRLEMRGIEVMTEARNLVDQLNRRLAKCRDRVLVFLSTSDQANYSSSSDNHRSDSDRKSFDLPTEVLELILSFIPDTRSLVQLSRASRSYYVAICQVLINRLRTNTQRLRGALPQKEGEMVLDENEAACDGLDRWQEHPEGIGYRDLERRVRELKLLVTDVSKWTRHWKPRRIRPLTQPIFYHQP